MTMTMTTTTQAITTTTTTTTLETALVSARTDRDAMYEEMVSAEAKGIGGTYLLDRRLAYGAAASRCRRIVERLAESDREAVRAALAAAGE